MTTTVKAKTKTVTHAPRFVLALEDGSKRTVMPFGPTVVNHTGIAPQWDETQIPGGRSILRRTNLPRRRWSAEFVLSHKSMTKSVQDVIANLQAIAGSKQRCRIHYGTYESGLWRVMSVDVSSVQRRKSDNSMVHATASIEFAWDGDNDGGMVARHKKGQKRRGKAKQGSTHKRVYVVKKGDNLFTISQKYYGDRDKWRRIADANGLRDARGLKVGLRLRIP